METLQLYVPRGKRIGEVIMIIIMMMIMITG